MSFGGDETLLWWDRRVCSLVVVAIFEEVLASANVAVLVLLFYFELDFLVSCLGLNNKWLDKGVHKQEMESEN